MVGRTAIRAAVRTSNALSISLLSSQLGDRNQPTRESSTYRPHRRTRHPSTPDGQSLYCPRLPADGVSHTITGPQQDVQVALRPSR
jgi:hypothetical protein